MSDEDRLPLPAAADMTEAQRAAAAAVAAGPRGALFGPFVPLVRAPALMDRLQQVGAWLRYDGELPRDVFELAVLLVARSLNQDFEWTHHRPLAEAAGVSVQAVDAVAHGALLAGGPSSLPGATDVQAATAALVAAVLDHRPVTDEVWAAAVEHVGDSGVVELLVVAGYYTTLAMVMNAARTPVPDGSGPGLPRLP
jgi:4-carboxymuconolactone decarboxylase